jgi:hypothetical protein
MLTNYMVQVDETSHVSLTQNGEVIQAEIVGHGDLYLCAVFLTLSLLHTYCMLATVISYQPHY